MIPLILPRAIDRSIRLAAKAAYPCEMYAVLLGEIGASVHVKDVWFPEMKQHVGSTHHLFSRRSLLEEGLAIADSAGLCLVADVHSHPRVSTREPSEADWEGVPRGWVHGICAVWKTKAGLRTALRFWPWIEAVETIINEGTRR